MPTPTYEYQTAGQRHACRHNHFGTLDVVMKRGVHPIELKAGQREYPNGRWDTFGTVRS